MEKLIRFTIICIFIVINCKSQEKFEIKEDVYSSILLVENNLTSFEVKRDIDQLNIRADVKPTLNNIFNRFFDKTKAKEINFYLKRNSSGKFVFEQIIFINKNERISIHKGTEDVYDVFLNDFEIDIKLCKNCSDEIFFTVYNKKNPPHHQQPF
jgi:hypothetical protein